MFEVGKSYAFAFAERDEGAMILVNSKWRVAAIDGNLISLEAWGNRAFILNTMSVIFHSAREVDADAMVEPERVDISIVAAGT